MKVYELDDMTGGWFVGDFAPNVMDSKDLEVGIKRYTAGTVDKAHYHKIGTEITAVVTGKVEMNGETFGPGKIIYLEPGTVSKFRAIEDSIIAVVKTPSAPDDKYLVEDE